MFGKIRAATAANRAYFLGIIAFLFFNFVVSFVLVLNPEMPDMLSSFLMYVPAMAGFGLISLWFMKSEGKQLEKDAPMEAKQIFLMIPTVLCGLIMVLCLSGIATLIATQLLGASKVEILMQGGVDEPTTFSSLLWSLVCFALLPAFFEELMFRGILQRANQPNLGNKAPIYAAVAFGLMHMNVISQWGLIAVGFLIGNVLKETKSLKMCMWYHFLHNSITFILSYVITKVSTTTLDATDAVDLSILDMPTASFIMVILIYAIVAVGGFVGAMALIRVMKTKKHHGAEVRLMQGEDTMKILPIHAQKGEEITVHAISSKSESIQDFANQSERQYRELNEEMRPYKQVNYIWYAGGVSLCLVLSGIIALASIMQAIA